MPNLFDYFTWRGDLLLSQTPFNNIDALILSRLSYAPLDGIISASFAPSLTIGEAAALYAARDDAREKLTMRQDLELLTAAGNSPRFMDMRLCGYVSRLDFEQEKQFAAMVIDTADGHLFVSFRGTDNSFVGWKEDFNMSFMPLVPSQREALAYLERCAAAREGLLRVGGHSKGGNLAVYASAFCPAGVQDRISRVYNHDGPGFHKETIGQNGFARIVGKVRTFVPQSSVVGMLLEHEERYTVIRSAHIGLFQHDLYTWEVVRDDFIRLETVSDKSRFVDRTLKTWVEHMSPAQREAFINGLFAILNAADKKDIREFSAAWPTSALAMLKSLAGLDEETRKAIGLALHLLIKAARQHISLIKPQFFA